MSSQFAQNVLYELNKFRSSPKSIQHQCELVRKGFSRIRAGDPFLNDIDFFFKAIRFHGAIAGFRIQRNFIGSSKA